MFVTITSIFYFIVRNKFNAEFFSFDVFISNEDCVIFDSDALRLRIALITASTARLTFTDHKPHSARKGNPFHHLYISNQVQ